MTGLFLNFDFKVFSNFLSLYNQNSQSQLASLTPDKKLDLVVTQQLTHRLWQMLSFKIVVVGDSGVGKTTLLFANGCNKFDSDVYHLIDTQSIHAMTPDGKPYSYGLWDTLSTEEYDRLWPLQYPNTDVFLVCFSRLVPKSLENVSEKWIPEIRRHCPGTPFLLVGTQIDLKEDRATIDRLASKNQAPISSGVGLETAKKAGAAKYLECSSLTMDGVKNVVDQAILQALKRADKSERKIKMCAIS